MKKDVLGGLALGLAVALPTAQVRADPAFATLLAFAGPDGAFPNAGLLVGSDGTLYGTATTGGPSQDLSVGGVAFSLRPAANGGGWTQTVLHLFGRTPSDGSSPHSRLLADRNGVLYGTTFGGGVAGQGTVYRLIPPSPGNAQWQEQVVYRFTGAADGANPLSDLVFDAYGRLYGTASQGGAADLGTVYRLTAPSSGDGTWTVKLLHSFSGADGASPESGLIGRTVSGVFTLFGTTAAGGTSGKGTVFSMTSSGTSSGSSAAPWTHAVLHSFSGGADGGVPVAGLTADKSLNLYGTTTQGGSAPAGSVGGLVFKLSPPGLGGSAWTEQVLHNFGGDADGQFPLGAPVLQSGGHLFATSGGSIYGGCTLNCGTAFMLTSANGGQSGPWNETILHSFSGADGARPSATLAARQDGSGSVSYYGVTEFGGASNLGTVFKVTP